MSPIGQSRGIDARLERLLGGAELEPLRMKMRRYFERLENGEAGGTLQLTQLSAPEQEALALLTGRPARPSRSARIDVGQLDAALLAAGIARSLREALELIDGPIVNRTALKEHLRARWSGVVDAGRWHRVLGAWLASPGATGLLRRLSRQDPTAAEQLLTRADAVLRRLPGGGVGRAQLAAETLGNAHALDSGQATASLVLAAWRHGEADITSAHSTGHQREEEADGERVQQADEEADEQTGEQTGEVRQPDERARDIWARAGVLVNELARPALFLNLPTRAQGSTAWANGEPHYLSLRSLLRTPPSWDVADRTVFVCENPNLVAIAADRLGAGCAPLVCTDGMPAAAQRTLLTQLTRAGARLQYHGDFDWPGLQIANHVMRIWPADPWRFEARDYVAAATSAPHMQRDLAASGVAASWDALLAPAMQHHGLAIAEEAVAGSLLEDLRRE